VPAASSQERAGHVPAASSSSAAAAEVPYRSEVPRSDATAKPTCRREPTPLFSVVFIDEGAVNHFQLPAACFPRGPKPTILTQPPHGSGTAPPAHSHEWPGQTGTYQLGWTAHSHERPCWELRSDALPDGPCTAILGFSAWQSSGFEGDIALLINGTTVASKLEGANCIEVKTVIQPEAGTLTLVVRGPDARWLRYLHLWPGCDAPVGTRAEFWPHPAHRDVPRLHDDAHGGPKAWNRQDGLPRGHPECAIYWGKLTMARHMPKMPRDRGADVNVIVEFLQRRLREVNKGISTTLGPPIRLYDGWYRFPIHLEDGDDEAYGHGWTRAWHGCKLEAVFATLHDGKLKRSAYEGRVLSNIHGVYVHDDDTAAKAENYMRWVPLCGDGVFWAAKWEVQVKKELRVRVKRRKTDQWILPEHAVDLVALWICCRSPDEMENGVPVSRAWDPLLEAHPARPTHYTLPPSPEPQTRPRADQVEAASHAGPSDTAPPRATPRWTHARALAAAAAAAAGVPVLTLAERAAAVKAARDSYAAQVVKVAAAKAARSAAVAAADVAYAASLAPTHQLAPETHRMVAAATPTADTANASFSPGERDGDHSARDSYAAHLVAWSRASRGKTARGLYAAHLAAWSRATRAGRGHGPHAATRGHGPHAT